MHSDHGGYDAALCGWDHCVCQESACDGCRARQSDDLWIEGYWR